MTEYTLKQMLDKFERNNSLKFEYLGDEDHGVEKGTVVHLSENGYVVDNLGGSILSYFNLGSKFRLVNEPVSVKEALKAAEDGKTIICELGDFIAEYHVVNDGSAFSRICDTRKSAGPVSLQEILYGKWFIEEGN